MKRSVVRETDYRKCLAGLREKADVFFLDPPYGKEIVPDCLERIETLDLLNGDGIIIAEHEKHDELPEKVGRFCLYRSRRYGKTMVTIYRVREEEEETAE